MAYGRKYSKHGNSKVLRNTPPRQNRECDWCDGWEHMMGNGQWMCGKTHGQCDSNGNGYNIGGFPRKRGYINEGIHTPRADDVPAMLSRGEFVQQKSAVNKYGVNFMERLNKGMVSEEVMNMNNGGIVKNNRRSNVRKISRNRQKPLNRTVRSRNRTTRSRNRTARGRSSAVGRRKPIRQFGYGGPTGRSSGAGGRHRTVRAARGRVPFGGRGNRGPTRARSVGPNNRYIKIDYTANYANNNAFWVSSIDGSRVTAYDCKGPHFTKDCMKVERAGGYALNDRNFFGGK